MGEVRGDIALSHVREREDGRTLRIAELWLKGLSFRKISAVTGYSFRTIQQSVAKSKEIWVTRKDLGLTYAIAEQLRRVDLVETNAWEAWERSQKDQTETRVNQTKDGVFKTRVIKTSAGDPRFLDTALKCIEQRCKLLGVYKPPEERAEMHVWGLTVVVDTPEQAEEILSYEQFKSMTVEAESVQPETTNPFPGSQNHEKSND